MMIGSPRTITTSASSGSGWRATWSRMRRHSASAGSALCHSIAIEMSGPANVTM
jgi:hypothetical protein